jgi:hypothetical protein
VTCVCAPQKLLPEILTTRKVFIADEKIFTTQKFGNFENELLSIGLTPLYSSHSPEVAPTPESRRGLHGLDASQTAFQSRDRTVVTAQSAEAEQTSVARSTVVAVPKTVTVTLFCVPASGAFFVMWTTALTRCNARCVVSKSRLISCTPGQYWKTENASSVCWVMPVGEREDKRSASVQRNCSSIFFWLIRTQKQRKNMKKIGRLM